MDNSQRYENYPGWVVVLSNLNQILSYGLGFLVMYKIGLIFAFLYLAYILVLEIRLLKTHCVDCYYWGRNCGFGKGRISALFFKKGDVARFCSKGIKPTDMIPDLLASLIPVLTGIVLIIVKFDFLLLAAVLVLILLTTAGNGFIRGRLVCRYCKQRDLGCPAERMFNK
jgi:hypothetical protein